MTEIRPFPDDALKWRWQYGFNATNSHGAMPATCIPEKLAGLIGMASEMQAAILIYERDVIVFANSSGREIYACQDWSKPVLFDNCFRRAVELGRIQDEIILSDPESHLVYAKMARAREASFQFRRYYDGILYDRHHIGLDSEWNAQIWLPVRPSLDGAADQRAIPGNLLEQIERGRAAAVMAAMLERMGIAVSLVGSNSKIIENSSLMVRCLRSGSVLARAPGNRLICPRPSDDERLQQAITAVASGRKSEALVKLPDAQLVAVMPANNGTAMVVLQSVAPTEPLQEILISTFGLSRPQAEVVVRIAAGETAEQIAIALDRKIRTVRQQIETSRAKIAAGRQQDIARIVTRAATLFGGIPPLNS